MQKSNSEDDKRIIVFDTTLRDGEQSPGISLDEGEKLEIAEQLARLGVDVIEAGFPVASQGDFEAVRAIARGVSGPVICGLSRTALADIDRCWEAIEPAAKRRIHTFIATSEIHMANKLKMTPEQVKIEAARAVAHAKAYTDDVEFSPEDASRSDFDFMCEVLQIAVDNGATTLNIPDTVGFAIPGEWGARIAAIRERVKGDYILSSHCHNDLGLAVANSLAAIAAGARQVECTVNGIGERAGNAAVEEIVMALNVRGDQYGGFSTGIHTKELARSSRLVSRLTGYPVQYNKAVVGRNAFAHESGIHQHGVLNERTTYEIMDPAAVGAGDTKIVLGKHSGRHAFADSLRKLGYDLKGDDLQVVFARFKELADKKIVLSEEDLEALVAEEVGDTVRYRYQLVSVNCFGGTNMQPTATVVLSVGNERKEGTASGDGMVEAACAAIRSITNTDGALTDYSVTSVTGGVDALADVALRLDVNGRSVPGRGLATDVVEASARAFLNAINRNALLVDKGMDTEVSRPGSLD
jgi:2-isopropylmalate synthase